MFKLGKHRPRRCLETPALGDFLPKAVEFPAVKPRGWQYALPPTELDCLGNDQYGDCACAGAMHLIQTDMANCGVVCKPTLQETLTLYSAVTGFDPNKPDTDNGTDLLSLLQYWKNTGIMVSDGSGNPMLHKIVGWAAVDFSSVAQMRWACDVFGGLYLGIQCPTSAMEDTSNWAYKKGSKIDGGHCINMVGQGGAGGHIQSWGMNIPFTWEFMLHYLDEAYVVVSDAWLRANGTSPSGYDLSQLLDAMAKL